MDKALNLKFVAGIASGVAVGMLVAPRRGIALRNRLAGKARAGICEMKQQAASLADKGKAEITRQQEGIKDALEAGKNAYHQKAG